MKINSVKIFKTLSVKWCVWNFFFFLKKVMFWLFDTVLNIERNRVKVAKVVKVPDGSNAYVSFVKFLKRGYLFGTGTFCCTETEYEAFLFFLAFFLWVWGQLPISLSFSSSYHQTFPYFYHMLYISSNNLHLFFLWSTTFSISLSFYFANHFDSLAHFSSLHLPKRNVISRFPGYF